MRTTLQRLPNRVKLMGLRRQGILTLSFTHRLPLNVRGCMAIILLWRRI